MSVFDKYGYKSGFAMNLGLAFSNDTLLQMIRNMQLRGYEFMDHTPNHATQFFTTNDTSQYSGKRGVDHIAGNKVCLSYDSIDTLTNYGTKRINGIGTVSGNYLISDSNGFFSYLSQNITDYVEVYFPNHGILCRIKNAMAVSSIDPDTLVMTNFWDDTVSLGPWYKEPFQIINLFGVHLTSDAVSLLAARTLEICQEKDFDRPYTWISLEDKRHIFFLIKLWLSMEIHLTTQLQGLMRCLLLNVIMSSIQHWIEDLLFKMGISGKIFIS